MFKNLFLVFAILFGLTAQADSKPYDKFSWGVNFEKARSSEAVGFEIHTKALYNFKLAKRHAYHSLLLGFHFANYPNLVTNSSSKFRDEKANNAYLGLRVFNAANSVYSDLAITHLMPSSSLANDSSTGLLIRFGYLLPYEDQGKTRYFKPYFSLTHGLGKADKLTSDPDLFNGFGVGISLLL